MSHIRKLLATALSIVACASLGALAGPAGATPGRATPGRATPALPMPTGGTPALATPASRSSARAAARARGHRRGRASAHRTRARSRARPRRASSSGASTPAATTPVETPAEGGGPGQGAAATIAAVLTTPCQNTELLPDAENIALVRAAVLCLINRERAQHGENPLQTGPQLEQAAQGHCNELVAEDYFAHVSPGGETPVDRIRATGYIPNPMVGYVIGENLAWGTFNLATPEAVVEAWLASPGHLANILEGQYRETGIGVTPAVPASLADGAPGATYAQEFGVIIQ